EPQRGRGEARLGQWTAPGPYARARAEELANRPTLAAAVANWYPGFIRDWGNRGIYAVVEISPYRGGDDRYAFGIVFIDQAASRPDAIQKMQKIARPQMRGWFLAVIGPNGIEASRPDGVPMTS